MLKDVRYHNSSQEVSLYGGLKINKLRLRWRLNGI